MERFKQDDEILRTNRVAVESYENILLQNLQQYPVDDTRFDTIRTKVKTELDWIQSKYDNFKRRN